MPVLPSDDLTAARRVPFHPLEIIPFFRRWKHSHVRDLLYTFIWNAIIAVGFTLVAIGATGRFSWRLVMLHQIFSQCIGFTIHAIYFVGGLTIENWVNRQSKIVIVTYYSVCASLGVFIGWIIGSFLLNFDIPNILDKPGWLAGIAFNSVVISFIILVIYTSRERKMLAEMAQERERARFAEVERSATLANLRMLQAQIEPHFLFNTLANVTSLIHPAPDKAKHMLESFITYLRGSLAASREETTTLEREFRLMRDFLDILKIRMGERLKVEIDLPDDLAAAAVPPMLIQPLVENAIKHGLEPKVEGGVLRLQAARDGANIRIHVIDSGQGFSGATSSGVGLRNVRERIKALFGDAGRLSIEENTGGGTRVVITLPASGAAA
ncbi:MAG: histidine kinase [Burkholderiales bacterium]|nr:histidine kinase [Burkholderiales bacterium]